MKTINSRALRARETEVRSRGKSRALEAPPPASVHASTLKREAGREGEHAAGQRRGPSAALYLRVSTREQTTDNQRPELEQLAQARGYELVRVYEEQTSAAASSRPAFERMLRDAHRGAFHVILVWALDRFGRSMVGNLQAVLELDRRSVQVVSYREPWLDMGGPARGLLVAIFSWVAEREREQLAARTRAGLEHARRKGVRLGRPAVRFDVQRAQALHARGASLRTISRELDVSVSTLNRALRKVIT
jgi:DNA invertase Pin-like site-specific DNA recombinase